jgi:hypothetical protein
MQAGCLKANPELITGIDYKAPQSPCMMGSALNTLLQRQTLR